jgi:hypothetical protein
MLRVPPLRQPDPAACFPTAACAVLLFRGVVVEYEDIAEACGLSSAGTVQERAIQGLCENEFEVEVLTEFDRETIADAIAEERPPILTLEMRPGVAQGHAVVICDLEGDVLTVIDPAFGEYRQLRWSEILPLVGRGITGVVLIGGVEPNSNLESQA